MKKRICKKTESRLTAYLHGELNQQNAQRVENHLAECESCRAELEAQRTALELLGTALETEPAPAELNPWYTLNIYKSSRRSTSEKWWYSPRFRAVLATGVTFSLFILLSSGLVIYNVIERSEKRFEPPPTTVARPKMDLKKPSITAVKTGRTRQWSAESVTYEDSFLPSVGGFEKFNTEQYSKIEETGFLPAMDNPLSTFSIDVDRASYANVRRFLNSNRLPPSDAVRIEEMINYFTYDYPYPTEEVPFSLTTEHSACPWNPNHQLALVGLQGMKIDTENLPPNNLTFLLDVSGSMNSPNKLPLLKSAVQLLIKQLRPQDRVSIVVYAGAAGLVLEPTSNKEKILEAIDRLNAGGSTAGGAGIELAYKTAMESFIENGNNRVILATDGDFNVGISSDGALTRLIEEKRKTGIYLTVLGFGTGNYKDSKMEQLADKGNGNYAYIDDLLEAKKVLVSEMGGTLTAIAKDVKIQIEFNPAQVKAYRLIGYENRRLANEEFDDDTKDAGELGAGHSVTALYEIIPANSAEIIPTADELKYQQTQIIASDEFMTVKLRYKEPDSETSRLLTETVTASADNASNNLRFASAVAEFGLLLHNSEYKAEADYDQLIQRAKAAKGKDEEGYRAEFIRLAEKAQLLNSGIEN